MRSSTRCLNYAGEVPDGSSCRRTKVVLGFSSFLEKTLVRGETYLKIISLVINIVTNLQCFVSLNKLCYRNF